MSVQPSTVTLDLSDMSRDPDSPYITQNLEILVEGDIPGTASLYISGGDGVYLSGVEINPRRKAPPFRAQAVIQIRRSSALGTREIEIRASGGDLKATTKLKLELSRSEVQVSITEPKPDSYTNPGDIKIRGKVSPPIEGLIVHVDLYHKYPELKTPEQIGGYKSGIRQWGLTVTQQDGTFHIDENTVAFKHFLFGGVRMDIGGGVWYIHFYTKGLKLFGQRLSEVDYQKPVNTVRGGVKTFETEYSGVPAVSGGDVPQQYVRKLIIREPEMKLEIMGGLNMYPKQSIGRNVFRRGKDSPKFLVTLTGTTHELVSSGIAEIRLNITRPGRAGVDPRPISRAIDQEMNYFPVTFLKPQHQGTKKSGTGSTQEDYIRIESKWIADWKWSGNYGGGVDGSNAEDIPIGIYGIRAELWDKRTNKLLNHTKARGSLVPDADSFFVIYDFDLQDDWITTPTCKEYGVFPHARITSYTFDPIYQLHQYDPLILTNSLKMIQFFGGFTQQRYRRIYGDMAQNPTTSITDTALVVSNGVNQPVVAQHTILDYDSSLDKGRYDTLEILRLPWAQRRGLCSDYSGIMIAYLRSVGIPCRYVTGRAYNPVNNEVSPHAWVEVWEGDEWHIFDPTNGLEGKSAIDTFAGVTPGGEYGIFYPAKGKSLWGSYQGYWVVAEKDPTTKDGVNIYLNYSYVSNIENPKFDRDPGRTLPGKYREGDSGQFDFTIRNFGPLDIDANVDARINITMVYKRSGTFLWWEEMRLLPNMPLGLQLPAGQEMNFSVPFTVPNGTIKSPKLRVTVWYPFRYRENATAPIQVFPAIMDSQDFPLPFDGPSTPSISANGIEKKLELPSIAEASFSEDGFTSKEYYDFQPLSLWRKTTSYPDQSQSNVLTVSASEELEFTINWPLEGNGRGIYIPESGSYTSDKENLNLETNYIVGYGDSGSCFYIFSPEITVSSISFEDRNGITQYEVTAFWEASLQQDCEKVFMSVKGNHLGAESPESICRIATQRAVSNGIALGCITPSVPLMVVPPSSEEFSFTVTNDACTQQDIDVEIVISKPLAQTNVVNNTITPELFRDVRSLHMPPYSSTNISMPLDIETGATALPWEISYRIKGGGGGKRPLYLSYPVVILIDEDLQLKPFFDNEVNVSFLNIADFEVSGLTTSLEPANVEFSAETSLQYIETLPPSESETLSWNIETQGSPLATFTITAESEGKVYGDREFNIPISLPGWIELRDVVVEAQPPRMGNPGEVGFELDAYNRGSRRSGSCWVELSLPDGCTGTTRINIPALEPNEEATLSGTLTYNLTRNFLVIAQAMNTRETSSSASIYVDMDRPEDGAGIYVFAPAILLLPLAEAGLIIYNRSRTGRED